MSIVTDEIECLAEDDGLCISEKDGHIKVYYMRNEEESLLAWYYNGDFHEAISEDIAQAIPSHLETADDAELLIEIILNEITGR